MRFELLLFRRVTEDVESRVLDRIFGPKRDVKIYRMMLVWLNERVEVVENCSAIMKNKSVYKIPVETMCKKKPGGIWKII
jgi:hypothetical protein